MRRAWSLAFAGILVAMAMLYWIMAGPLGNAATLSVSFERLESDMTFELFIDSGQGLYATPPIVARAVAGASAVTFPLPETPLRGFRLDPGVRPATILIKAIDLGAYRWAPGDIAHDFRPNGDIAEFSASSQALRVVSRGEDPFFVYEGDFGRVYRRVETLQTASRWALMLLGAALLGLLVYGVSLQRRVRTDTEQRGPAVAPGKCAVAVLFVSLLWLPFIGRALQLGPKIADQENRPRAAFPDLATTPFADLPAAFERYFNDNFWFRNLLIRINNVVRVRGLQTSPTAQVVIGKHGWLFYVSEAASDGESFSDFRGEVPYSESQLEHIAGKLEERRSRCAAFGSDYVLAVVPNKHTVYPEQLPARLANDKAVTTQLDQLIAYLAQHSALQIVDLRLPLAEASKERLTFFKTDTHWNSYGAFVGYQAVMRRLSQRDPRLEPLPLDAFRLAPERTSGGDLAGMLGVQGLVADDGFTLELVARPPTLQPTGKAVFMRDSFGDRLLPLLALHFAQVTTFPHEVDLATIARERPAVVIQLIVERYLSRLL